MHRVRKGIECVKFLLSGFKIHAQNTRSDVFSRTFIYDFDKLLYQCIPKTVYEIQYTWP